MTEPEWQCCTDPQRMLTFLRGKASGRKLRLFACACCRRVWGLLSAEESRQAVLEAERFADGLAGDGELTAAGHHATRPAKDATARRISNFPGAAGKAAAALAGSHAYSRVYAAYGERLPRGAGQRAAKELGLSAQAAQDPRDAYVEAEANEAAAQSTVLRDIFGNPFQPSPRIDPAWLVRNDGTVRKLADAIYEGRVFDRLPILADALEEAGCNDAELLGHLRGPGPHVKGCWALDLLLGKG
jgi:hypothetical protein